MHRPSRVLQQCICNIPQRMRSADRRNINIRARHLSIPDHLQPTSHVHRNTRLFQRYYSYRRRTNKPPLLHFNCSSLNQGLRRLSTCAASTSHDPTKHTPSSIKQDLDQAEINSLVGNETDWNKLVLYMEKAHGAHGVRAVLDRLRERGCLDAVMGSDSIRNTFLYAGLESLPDRQAVFACADDLLQQFDYRWPNFYTKCIHHLLEKGAFEEAVEAHLQLSPRFVPDYPILGMFFENFVRNPDRKMQQALTEIYLSLPQHNLYDIIIPALFESGQSSLAKSWRRTLLRKDDLPSSDSSGPFLAFLASYYTNTNFAAAERRIIDMILDKVKPKRSKKGTTIRCIAATSKAHRSTRADIMDSFNQRHGTTENLAQSQSSGNSLVDGLVEKLFASSWTPVNFAMQLAKNAGIQSVGSRALQALALRASNAAEVNELIETLQKLEISIPTGAYCTAVSNFAKHGHDTLLSNLLQSDIHPEEFDDEETRQMILENSIRRHDTKQESLMRGVMSVIDSQTPPLPQSAPFQLANVETAFGLEKLLFDEPWRMKLALERLASLDFQIGSIEASAILRKAFAAFPVDRYGIVWNSSECIRILDEVIGVVRCIAAQNVGIRSEYWKMLLLGLGQQRRLDTLEQLSLEIVDMYDHSLGGWFPVHKADMPKMSKLATEFLRRTENSGYIPADLSYYHHHHPLFKIFDGRFQRSTVKSGFDGALNIVKSTSLKPAVHNAAVTRFNVGSGIHILAKLRDRGIFIDLDLVESAARNCLYSSQRLRQRDGDPRTKNWLSLMQMKEAIDRAWGSALMPTGYIVGLVKKDLRALPASKR